MIFSSAKKMKLLNNKNSEKHTHINTALTTTELKQWRQKSFFFFVMNFTIVKLISVEFDLSVKKHVCLT